MAAMGTLSGDDLIVVTGGVGFIGSHVASALAEALPRLAGRTPKAAGTVFRLELG